MLVTETLYEPGTRPSATGIAYLPSVTAAPPAVAAPCSAGRNWIIADFRGAPSIFTSPEIAWRGNSSRSPPQPAIKAAARPNPTRTLLAHRGRDMLVPP